MYVYLTVMFLCSIPLYAMRNNNKKILPLAIVFTLIWTMMALQEGWGGDYYSYVELFDLIQGQSVKDLLSDTSHGELGYKIVMSFMPNPHTGFIIGIGVWCFACAFFFYHFVPQKWWFFAIFFVFFDKSILMGMTASYMRMAIANSLLIFAFYNVYKGNRWMPFVLIFIGFFFHKSVIIMLPMLFLPTRKSNLRVPVWLGIIVAIFLFSIIAPSLWINFTERILMSSDQFENYAFYIDHKATNEIKGITLIVVFYWVYLLSQLVGKDNLKKEEYLMLYLALIRIIFDMLPGVGMSVRFFYFIDLYFFAGMMVIFNHLPKGNPNRIVLAITLLLMFGYVGFYSYSKTPFFAEHWATYNFIF